MADDKHLELSNTIKTVHLKLREDTIRLGPKHAWENHCNNKEMLEKYAQSMRDLATNIWDKNNQKSNSKASSRFKWILEQCNDYFFNNGIIYQRNREYEIIKRLPKTNYEEVNYELSQIFSKIKLLDVGSCYNPFKESFEHLDVLPIDLYPACEDVKICDFLNVLINEDELRIKNNSVENLQISSFDVVVFSLLLEYLPTSEQRFKCVEKAYEVLKPEGLLVIITPDSNHIGSNAKIMKAWRYSISNLGFMRIKYEKLPHIHCIMFRKCIFREVGQRWTKMHSNEQFQLNCLNIPQDFKKTTIS